LNRKPLFLLVISSLFAFAGGCADEAPSASAGLCGEERCEAGFVCFRDRCRDPGEGQEEPDLRGEDVAAPEDQGAGAPEDLALADLAIADAPEVTPEDEPDLAAADAVEDQGERDAGCEGCLVTADPEALNLTVSAPGQVVEQSVRLWNTGPRAARVRAVFVDHPSLEVVGALEGAELPSDGGVVELPLRYTAAELAAVSTQVRVLLEPPQTLVIPVRVSSKLANDPCVEVLPRRVDFGQVARGDVGARQVRVRNCGQGELSFARLERGSFLGTPTPASFQWSTASALPEVLTASQEAVVEVTFTPGRQGLALGSLYVHSDDPSEPRVQVDLSGLAAAPPIEAQDVHIQLEWDSDNCDVDLHFLSERDEIFQCPQTCFYANAAPDWGAQGDWRDDPFLDTDNIRGFGPENINLQAPAAGRYRIAVHYYLDSYEDSFSTDTRATVRVYFRGQLAATYGPQHLERTGQMWDVAWLDWPAATLTPINQRYETPHRGCR
jgi:hypothetical protein